MYYSTRLWSTYYGGSGALQSEGIFYHPALQEFVVTGYLSGNGLPIPSPNPTGMYNVTSNSGGYDCFVSAFTGDYHPYKPIWSTYLGGNGDDRAYSTCIDNIYQCIYVVGKTGSSNFPTQQYKAGFIQPSKASVTGHNAFITRFDYTPLKPLALDEVNEQKNALVVFPNPTSDNVTVEFENNKAGMVTFNLYTPLGQLVYSQTIYKTKGLTSEQINLSLLPDAAYILKVTSGNEIYHQKVIKLQ